MKDKYKSILKFKKQKIPVSKVLKTIQEIRKKILIIMKNHIGKNKSLSKRKLFIKIYDYEPEHFSDLQYFMMWELIKKGMHHCRKYTKCFIISELDKNKKEWYFWVANDINDYHVYKNNIERNIKAMRSMVDKCKKSINKKWYRQEWKK